MSNNNCIVVAYNQLESFKKENSGITILDKFEDQIEELFFIRNPRFRFEKGHDSELSTFRNAQKGDKEWEELGSWIYFPWKKQLVHYLSEDTYLELRTARNKNLISNDEQDKLYKAKIGVAGLSVGSHVLSVLAMTNIGGTIKLADLDVVSASNLNRVRYDATQIGQEKCQLGYEYLSQVNPYLQIEKFEEGVNKENIEQFLNEPKLDILIEEMDDLEMKIRIRFAAKKLGIPVIMATDNGDNVIVDVERYDLDPDLPIFNGLIGDITMEEFEKFDPRELPRLASKIVGEKFIVPRMLTSLQEVGKTLYSWPQLGGAAALSGVVAAYVAKKIILGEKIRTGKMEVNLDEIFTL